MMTGEKKRMKGQGLILLALICFFNANIGVLDIFPDLIGSLIFVFILKDAAQLSPYFQEARSGFFKLFLCNTVKFFCQFSVFNRNNAVTQGDMSALFCITFFVLDTIFVVSASENLFKGLFYLGQRSDAKALYAPFPLRKTSANLCDPEILRGITPIFFAVKGGLATVPEFLRLSRDPTDMSADPAALYPTLLAICAAAVTLLGIVWLFLCVRYLKAIKQEGLIHDALRNRLNAEETALYHDRVRRHTFRFCGILLIVAVVLLLPLYPGKSIGLNATPYFLCPFLFFLFFGKMSAYLPRMKHKRIIALIATPISLASYILQATFFEKYALIDVINNPDASRLYRIYTMVYAADTLFHLLLLGFLLYTAFAFIRCYTVCDENSSAFTAVDRDYQKSTKVYCSVCIGVFAASALARFFDVIQRGQVSVIFSNPNNGLSSITTVVGSLPWFSTLATFLTIFSVITAGFMILRLKDAFRLRYPDPDEEEN